MTRVLIVEDNRELAENLAEILENSGHEVDCVDSAEAAEQALGQSEYAGVVSDLRLPGRSGLQLLEQMRQSAQSPPLVLMTAFADLLTTKRAEQLGALAVLMKPLNLQQLAALVDEFSQNTRSVLIVEDNHQLAENLADSLRLRGFQPLSVNSVEAALKLRRLPRVALVDFRLPDGTGIDVIERLTAKDPRIAIVLVSGHPEELQRQLDNTSPSVLKPHCLKHVLQKPLRIEEVLDIVDAVSHLSS